MLEKPPSDFEIVEIFVQFFVYKTGVRDHGTTQFSNRFIAERLEYFWHQSFSNTKGILNIVTIADEMLKIPSSVCIG